MIHTYEQYKEAKLLKAEYEKILADLSDTHIITEKEMNYLTGRIIDINEELRVYRISIAIGICFTAFVAAYLIHILISILPFLS